MKGMVMPRHIAGEHSDLAIGDLAGRAGCTGVRPARRLARFQKAGLIDPKTASSSSSVSSAYSHIVAQRVGSKRGAEALQIVCAPSCERR